MTTTRVTLVGGPYDRTTMPLMRPYSIGDKIGVGLVEVDPVNHTAVVNRAIKSTATAVYQIDTATTAQFVALQMV